MSALGDIIGGFFSFLLDGIKALFDLLIDAITGLFSWLLEGIGDLLKFLFVPSDNLGDEFKAKIEEKMPFISQISQAIDSFLNIDGSTQEPNFSITYYGASAKIVDFSLVEKYIPIIHSIIIAIAWGTFIFRIYKRIPSIIGGFK